MRGSLAVWPQFQNMPELDLDRFDRQLLTLVQQDAALTAEQLAEHVSLSASAIQRRLKRLREQGVIQRQELFGG